MSDLTLGKLFLMEVPNAHELVIMVTMHSQ